MKRKENIMIYKEFDLHWKLKSKWNMEVRIPKVLVSGLKKLEIG